MPAVKKKMLGTALWLLTIGAVVFVALAVLLFVFQAKMIYYPQPYRADYKRLIPPRGVEINYRTACGAQTAFYVPPRSADEPTTVPSRLWVLFGGNGSLALFWGETVSSAPDSDAGYLLVDYPGYGKCEGKPSPKSIAEGSNAALDALAKHLKTDPRILETDMNVVGHSLGAASALQFASEHPIRRAILAAPFTSMSAMAREVVGRVFATILTHNFDNAKQLDLLSRRQPRPKVVILHGDDDNIVPARMGRELAAAHKEMISYHEIPEADHVTVLDQVSGYLAP